MGDRAQRSVAEPRGNCALVRPAADPVGGLDVLDVRTVGNRRGEQDRRQQIAFSRLWLLPPSEKLVMEDRLLSGISDSDPQLLTAREQLPEYVTLARTSAVPPAELQRDVGRLPTDQLWLLRAAVAGSKQTGGN